MQSKNLITFFILSMAVLVGWSYLHNKIWPPKPRPPVLTTEDSPVHDYTRLTLAPLSAGRGIDTAFHIATEVALLNKASFPPIPPLAKQNEEKPKPPPVVEAPKVQPRDIVEIGGAGFRLQARLTPKGAGVEQVILTDFDQAIRLHT